MAQGIANIEMLMGRLVSPGRDGMDVDVKNPARNRCDGIKPRFLHSLPERHGKKIWIAVGMASRLQPTFQFPVMGQQYLAAIAIDQPCRTSDMAGNQAPQKTIRMIGHEVTKPFHGLAFFRKPTSIISQSVQ